MLNEAEYRLLDGYIQELDTAIYEMKQTGDPSHIYDTSTAINALYGKSMDGIADAYDTMAEQAGLAQRSAMVIAAILKKYRISYESGGGCKVKKINDSFLEYASSILGDTEKGLTGAKIIKHCNKYAIDFKVDIPITSSDFGKFGSKVPNKRTALLRNLHAFNGKQQFQIIKELSGLDCFEDNLDVEELKKRLYAQYGYLAEEKISNTELVAKTKHWLEEYPQSFNAYNEALEKYDSKIFERNMLDDMRLSFELLVKDLLGNDKSLENQTKELGGMLKNASTSVELRNMVPQVIKYYTDFQNHHVKHNDKINSDELEYIIELTSVIMKFLIKISGGKG